jgi:hypothetical protein
MRKYYEERTHHAKRCKSNTPMQTFRDRKEFFEEKNLGLLVA